MKKIVRTEDVNGLWNCYKDYVPADLTVYNGKIYKRQNVMVGPDHKIELETLTAEEAKTLKSLGGWIGRVDMAVEGDN